MRDVVDPELGINVVDLGLVYGITVDDTTNDATIDMTLTSAACPLTDVIEDQTAQALERLVHDFRINWVWMPPWGPTRSPTRDASSCVPSASASEPAASEPASRRRLELPAARVEGWLGRFAERHGPLACTATPDALTVTAPDGAEATLAAPFPPMRVVDDRPCAGLLEHLATHRRIGVLLVRAGGAAVGVVEVAGPQRRLVASKIERRHVQGRSAAGGWSQQRFARRREGQARVAFAAAADAAARVLVPESASLDAVVLGGDRRALDTVLADRRLEALRPLVRPGVLDVPEPRQHVLDAALTRLDAVVVTVRSDGTSPDRTSDP
jgi:metal-sulfur cluster biosynthetic enzyme